MEACVSRQSQRGKSGAEKLLGGGGGGGGRGTAEDMRAPRLASSSSISAMEEKSELECRGQRANVRQRALQSATRPIDS